MTDYRFWNVVLVLFAALFVWTNLQDGASAVYLVGLMIAVLGRQVSRPESPDCARLRRERDEALDALSWTEAGLEAKRRV